MIRVAAQNASSKISDSGPKYPRKLCCREAVPMRFAIAFQGSQVRR